MNDVARLFLEAYARGGEVEGGWKFGKALQQAHLDYSEESLERVDLLLKAIRERAKPQHDEFLADPQGRNFLSLLAYYLMAVLSRRTGVHIDWHDTASARRAVADWANISDTPFTRVVALAPDQGLLFLPLVWLHDRVFELGLGQVATASDYLHSVAAELDYDLPMAWWNAARVLGVAASSLMAVAADGRTPLPQTGWQHPRGQRANTTTFSFDGPDALARGEAFLKDNPEGATWKSFAHPAVHPVVGQARRTSFRQRCRPSATRRCACAWRSATGPRRTASRSPSSIRRCGSSTSPRNSSCACTRPSSAARNRRRGRPAASGRTSTRAGARCPRCCPRPSSVQPAYATGEQVRIGDAVLTDGGLYPGRVVQVVPGEDGQMACAFKDSRGVRRTATSTQLQDGIVFVERSPHDHGEACVAWLEQRMKQRAGARLPASPLLTPAHAAYALGNLMWQGIFATRNQASAKQLWEAAAQAGNPAAELALAQVWLDGDTVRADVPKGLALLRSAVDKRHPPALARLGQELETGLRMPADVAQAIRLLEQASAAGSAHATYRLAWMYRIGKGVRHDMARCMALLAQAAAGGFAQAQYELAVACTTGDGVAQDDERAIYWLERAVQGDHGEAMIMLAGKYERGRGVPQDLVRAVELYRAAADRKIPAAWYHLGVLTADGRGLDRDLREAMRLMTMAARDGVQDAREQLEDFGLALTRESRG